MWREKMLVLTMRKDNAKRAAPNGAARCIWIGRDGVHTVSTILRLQFRSSSHQSLASVVRRELLEVLDEA